MRLLHIGQCSTQPPFSSLQQALIPECDYRFISCSDKEMNEKAISVSKKWKPEIVFLHIQASGVISEETVIKLKENGAWVCNWTGDIRVPTPKWFYDIGKHIDLTLFSNEEDAVILREYGVNAGFLQIGIDENIYNSVGEINKKGCIIFMANNYNGDFPLSNFRQEIAENLRRKYRERFGLFGSGWRKGLNNGNVYSSQPMEASIYRGSKMAINISHFDAERYTSDRMFRIMGSGTLCLCKTFKGWERDFKDKENIVMWDDYQQLVKLIDYYLLNETERLRIAKNGYELVHSNYKFSNFVKTLIKYYHASF